MRTRRREKTVGECYCSECTTAADYDPIEEMEERIKSQAQRIEELKAERDKLREFFESLALDVWGYSDPDGGDFQDRAVEQGLLVEVPADEAFKAEYDSDTMYTWIWSELAEAAKGE